MSWTESRVELLRKLWADGLSCAQIAAELGAGLTRNAVIGKIHRLGRAERAVAKKPGPRVESAVVVAEPPAVIEPAAPGAGVTLFAAGEHQCRWPHGDPLDLATFRFCGARKVGETPYCGAHAALAFNIVVKPRRPRARRVFLAEGA